MVKTRFSAVHGLLLCLLAVALVLGLQVYGWATDACQVPNPSTVFCTANEPAIGCSAASERDCTAPDRIAAFERNQFPQGAVSSKSGTTKQAQADCWRRKYCVWNPDADPKCSANTNFDAWKPGDKTVVGDATCPTKEE